MNKFLAYIFFLSNYAFAVGETPETAINLTGDAEIEIHQLLNAIPDAVHAFLWNNNERELDNELVEILFDDPVNQQMPTETLATHLFPNIQHYGSFLENSQYMNPYDAQILNNQLIQMISQEYQGFLTMANNNQLSPINYNYYNSLFDNYLNYQHNLMQEQALLQQALMKKVAPCALPTSRLPNNNRKGGGGNGKNPPTISVFATPKTAQRSM